MKNRATRWRERQEPNIREKHETGILRQGAGTAGERRVEMYRLAERDSGANGEQGHYTEEMHEMARPIRQAMVGLAQVIVEFQDRLLRGAR